MLQRLLFFDFEAAQAGSSKKYYVLTDTLPVHLLCIVTVQKGFKAFLQHSLLFVIQSETIPAKGNRNILIKPV